MFSQGLGFLTFSRNLFSRAYHSNAAWTKESASVSLYSDDYALEFLALHGHEINRAKFFLSASLSGGKGEISTIFCSTFM
jgi:hypothetical protein